MNATLRITVLALISTRALLAQAVPSSSESFCKKLRQNMYISVAPVVAEKLLTHKVDPVWIHQRMEARVSGTVVVQFELGKRGEVLCSRILSGPKLLQQSVLDAIQKYEYKPYLLNGEAVVVSTTASITVSNY